MNMPIGLILFFLGLFISLISYIWAILSKRLDKLEHELESLNLDKCRTCEPATEEQVKELLTNEFNKFRLELFRAGVLKVQS